MLGDFWKKPEEISLTKPIASRVEFYENSLDTLNKKVSFYLLKKNEANREMKGEWSIRDSVSHRLTFIFDRTDEIPANGSRHRKKYPVTRKFF